MSKTILMVCDFYAPFIGGAERQVQLLGIELAERGYTVHVATVQHVGLPRQETHDGVTLHRVRGLLTSVSWFSKDIRRRYHPPFPDPGITLGLWRLIRQVKPDIVHATGWSAYSVAAALTGTDIPLVISVRDYGYSCAARTMLFNGAECSGPHPVKCLACTTSQYYSVPKAIASVLGVFAGKALLNRKTYAAHSISTYVQRTTRRDLLNWQGNDRKEEFIPEFVIPSFLMVRLSADAPDSFLARLPSEPFILYVGALQRHKGIHVLLAAYKRLHQPPPLVMIGTPWHDTPREFPPGVQVIHNVPHYAVMAAWERCMFGVAPSIWPEPLGMVIIEALSKGKAVISTNLGGPTDAIEDGINGFLVPPNDVNALNTAMRKLISDDALRSRMGQAASEYAQRYMAAAIVPQFEELYRNVKVDISTERRAASLSVR